MDRAEVASVDTAGAVLGRAEAPAPIRGAMVRSTYRASGRILVHGTPSEAGPVHLTWRATDHPGRTDQDQVVVSDELGLWHGDFVDGTHELVRATVGSLELLLVAPVELSRETERADIELLVPGYHFVDVRSAEPPFERLRDLAVRVAPHDTITLLPQGAQVRRKRGGAKDDGVVQRLIDAESLAQVAPGVLQLVGQSAPLVFRSSDLRGRLTVSAEGCLPLSLDCSGLEPITTHSVAEAVRLHVTFANAPTSRAEYDVVLLAKGVVLAEELGVRPTPITFANLPRREELRISVARHGPIGNSLPILDAPVSLSKGRDSYFVVDLAQRGAVGGVGSLTVSVAAQEAVPRMDSWFVVLQPAGGAPSGVSPGGKLRRPDMSHLKSWTVLATSQRYQKQFESVAVGDYTLTLHPIGLTRDVCIVAGEATEVALAIPAMAELHIWPIDAKGGAIAEPTRIGNLAWRVGGSEEAEITLQDVALQRAHMAAFSETGWWIVAPVGERVTIQFVGNPSHRAQKLTMVPAPGRTDETMQFHGL